MLLNVNPKIYEVKEYVATNIEANPWMLSALKNEKPIWSMNPEENFETSMIRRLVILVALNKSQIGQGSVKCERFLGDPLWVLFLTFILYWYLRNDQTTDE